MPLQVGVQSCVLKERYNMPKDFQTQVGISDLATEIEAPGSEPTLESRTTGASHSVKKIKKQAQQNLQPSRYSRSIKNSSPAVVAPWNQATSVTKLPVIDQPKFLLDKSANYEPPH